mmetsp:Transcript_13534/g.44022  ORF Transcript_13534/g.44022 Transcript_13534/m.44022 type:complete len:238 (-) Transcript_13534:177-890(-)
MRARTTRTARAGDSQRGRLARGRCCARHLSSPLLHRLALCSLGRLCLRRARNPRCGWLTAAAAPADPAAASATAAAAPAATAPAAALSAAALEAEAFLGGKLRGDGQRSRLEPPPLHHPARAKHSVADGAPALPAERGPLLRDMSRTCHGRVPDVSLPAESGPLLHLEVVHLLLLVAPAAKLVLQKLVVLVLVVHRLGGVLARHGLAEPDGAVQQGEGLLAQIVVVRPVQLLVHPQV